MSTREYRKVWLKDVENAWVKAYVVDENVVTTPAANGDAKNKSVKVVSESTNEESIHLVSIETGDGETVKSRNLFEEDDNITTSSMGYETIFDLTKLTHLHEAEILEALHARFGKDHIYTMTGPILLAVNPFKTLPIYSADQLGTYYSVGLMKSQGMSDAPNLPPHVFAIADASYRNLIDSSLNVSTGRLNQSILVSGESGGFIIKQ